MGASTLFLPLMCYLLTVATPAVGQITETNFVEIEEPAFLVGIPSQPVQLSGGRISMTCVAYGNPAPNIVWSSNSQGISDYSTISNSMINVFSSVVNDPYTNLTFVYSVLELCAADYNDSLVTDYRCTTMNELSTDPSRIPLGTNTAVFDIRPMINEPAVIIAAPTEGRYLHNGARFSATCAAYGSPRPEVWFRSPSLDIDDFRYVNDPAINVYTEDIDIGDYVFVATTLEICGEENDLSFYQRYITEYECHTTNGVMVDASNAIGVQSVEFTPTPFVVIQSFSFNYYTHRMEVDFTFGGRYNPDVFGCFHDKITYASAAAPGTSGYRTYTPRIYTECTIRGVSDVRITMDTRDYLGFIDTGFTGDRTDVYLYTNPGSETAFGPPIVLEQISNTTALQRAAYNDESISDQNFEISAFDIYKTQSVMLLYIHWDVIVDRNSFDVSNLRFAVRTGIGFDVNMPPPNYDPNEDPPLPDFSGQYQHTSGTNLHGGLGRTSVIQISQSQRSQLDAKGICRTSSSGCFIYFDRASFVNAHNGFNNIEALNRGAPFGGFQYYWEIDMSTFFGSVYMQYKVDFVGAGATYDIPLTRGQPYRLRSNLDETVTRITCHGVNDTDINPKIINNGHNIDETFWTRNWPITMTVSYPLGVITTNTQGLFTCTMYENTANISHIVHSRDPYIHFLNGDEYTVELTQPIVSRFTYSSSAVTNFMVTLPDGNPPSFEAPLFLNTASFTAEVRISQALFSMTGNYTIRIGGASYPFRINVVEPRIELSPAVLAFMPSDGNMASITCIPSYPDIPVAWIRSDVANSQVVVSRDKTYSFPVNDLDLLEDVTFMCLVVDPASDANNPSFVDGIRKSSTFRNINESLSLFRNGRVLVENDEILVVNNRFSEPTNLECLGHIDSGYTDLYWTIIREGDQPLVPQEDFDNENYTVTLGDNYITLSIKHSIAVFRGSVRCNSRTNSDNETNLYIQGNAEEERMRCGFDIDPVWRIRWRPTFVGALDAQPCPQINGKTTTGTAVRRCGYGGFIVGALWEDVVDISLCRSTEFDAIVAENDLFQEDDSYLDDLNYRIRADKLSNMLNAAILPGFDSLYAQDLRVASSILSDLIASVIRERPSVVHLGSVETFDSLLFMNNTGGWTHLRDNEDRSSVTLLNSAEMYARYLYDSVYVTPVMVWPPGILQLDSDRGSIIGQSYEISLMNLPNMISANETFMIGMEGDDLAFVHIDANLLQQQSATGLVFLGFMNLNNYLPRDQPDFNENRTSIISSHLLSVEIISSDPSPPAFDEDYPVMFTFETLMTGRVGNPRVVFWDNDLNNGEWSEEGINSTYELLVDTGNFRVQGNADHLTTFGVALDVLPSLFTIPLYVGCGVILLACCLAIFMMIMTCCFDSVRRFFSVSFFVHMSFFFSLVCAFVAFLAGLETAIQNRLGCAATAGLLHYFFTAAFSWLLCESMLISWFGYSARKWQMVFLYFVIGWGVPAIPVAVGLGVLHPLYGTPSQCWFQYDGSIGDPIVMVFLIPKIILFGSALIIAIFGAVVNCIYMWQNVKVIQPSLFGPYSCMLWFLWTSVIILSLLLASTWVTTMVLVNVDSITFEVVQWVFLGLACGLGVYIFIFSVGVLIVNRNIDYERFFAKKGAELADPGGVDYRNLAPLPEKRFSTGVPITLPSVAIANPVFGEVEEDEDSFDDLDEDEEKEDVGEQ